MTATTPEYHAVRHLLTTPTIADRTTPHIGAADFDWVAIHAASESMSGGEQVLVGVAHDLWHGAGSIAAAELPRRLGPSSYRRVLDALELTRRAA